MRMHLCAVLLLLVTLCQAQLNLAQPATAGVASWYRMGQGRKTASGERFDRRKYTAASRFYRVGTMLKVTYPRTGAFVIVRVNDRGPFVRGRVIDLSERAAQSLGLKPQGIGLVEIQPVHLWREP